MYIEDVPSLRRARPAPELIGVLWKAWKAAKSHHQHAASSCRMEVGRSGKELPLEDGSAHVKLAPTKRQIFTLLRHCSLGARFRVVV